MIAARNTLERAFLIAIKESFIALLPFIVVNSLLALVLAIVDVWQPSWQQSDRYLWLSQFGQILFNFFPLMALLSLSFHFSKYLELSAVAVASVSIGSLIALHIDSHQQMAMTQGFSFLFGDARAIILPILVAYLLRFFMGIKAINFLKSTQLSSYLKLHLNLLFPLITCFIAVTMVMYASSFLLGQLFESFKLALESSGLFSQLIVRVISTHVLWCFGVHGDIAYMLVFGIDNGLQQIAPNLTLSQFTDLFVLLGGSGATHSLLIAIFIASKDRNMLNVAKLSLPFVLFNINEILIYGLPIIFNLRLILPFIIVPVVNTLVGYLLVSAGWITFSGNEFPWIMPILLNGFVAGGSMAIPLLQLLLIAVGVAIYLPFVRHYSLQGKGDNFDKDLIKRIQLQIDIDKIAERNYTLRQSEDLQTNVALEKTIKEVLNGELLLYYQPKVSLVSRCVVGYEALLRLKTATGAVVGPYFIPDFDQAGYGNLIDSFVINRLAKDMRQWADEAFYPRISLNLNPNSVVDKATQDLLVERLGDYAQSIDIELLESAFISDLQSVEQSMVNLRAYGFSFVIDDFGTGYSSISLLSKIKIDGIKLDRSILENIKHDKGRILYRHTCMLCKSLGFYLVAEGVETKEEEIFVRSAGIDTVQGWLYAKALPRQDAKHFAVLQDKLSDGQLASIKKGAEAP
ncbi:diguanylate phosphodiesterase [Shewanella colwelliana]|uniref:EAL domain-containing protein n=1 Tax=Shewanella colwelliana TaxID=23 RepID=UPI001BC5C7FF|nr:EAL domain-containing protein [Shewanella colwelliana]GIU20572.1 diguanylate phosphodiesterase [Shewanella colwelliana]